MRRDRFNRIGFLFLGGLFFLLWSATRAPAVDRIVFSLDWLPYGKHTNYYAAVDKGFYKEEGLELTINRGFGGQDTIKQVASGKADLSISDPPSVVQGRARGILTRNIAMIFSKAVQTIFVMADSGIEKPENLDGKTIGDTKASQVLAVLDAFRALHRNFKYTLVPMAPAAKNPSLIAGKVDAITTYITALPALRGAAAKVGKKVRAFPFSEWGLDIYSDGLIASDETIAKRRNLVRRFVRASLKGLAWSIDHPQEATELFHNHFPTQNRALTREFWNVSVAYILTPGVRKHGLGYMNPEKMAKTVTVTLEAYELKRVSVEDVYTTRFLPKPGYFPNPPAGAYPGLKN